MDLAVSAKRVSALLVTVFAVPIYSCDGGAAPLRQADFTSAELPLNVTVQQLNGWQVALLSTEELGEVTLYFADGASEQRALSGNSVTVHSDSVAQLSYLKAGTRVGDYWYFDSAGKWLPNGYVPKFGSFFSSDSKAASAVWVGNTQLQVSSTDTYSEVKVGYDNGSIQTFTASEAEGIYELHLPGEHVEAVRITLQSDGSKWYFDAQGNTLSQGSKWYQDLD